MKFKIGKYITCVIMLVVLIGIATLSYASAEVSSPFDDIPVVVIEDDEEEETPTNPGDGGNTPVTIPVFADGINCFNYALNLLREGAGFEVHTYVSCSSSVLGITAYQYIYSHRQHIKDKVTYEEILTNCDVSVGENYFKYQYLDYAKNEYGTRKTSNKDGVNSVFKASELEEIRPMDEFLAEQPSTFTTFPYKITAQNTTSSNFAINSEKNKEYYTFKLNLKREAIDENFFNLIILNANATEFNWESMEISCKINKKTMKFVSVTQTDIYGMRARGFYLNITQTSTYTFSKVNTAFEITSNYKQF